MIAVHKKEARRIASAGLTDAVTQQVRKWHRLNGPKFEETLYQVPHDALLIIAAGGA
jgi:hypothetical protein